MNKKEFIVYETSIYLQNIDAYTKNRNIHPPRALTYCMICIGTFLNAANLFCLVFYPWDMVGVNSFLWISQISPYYLNYESLA